jgi:serine/threonine protein kinase
LYIVTEFFSNGSITDLVKKINKKYEDHNNSFKWAKTFEKIKSRGLKNKICRLYLIDLLKALYYCHNIVKVIHRDIKPDNIMINHNNEAVLIDFGVSALIENK